MVETVLMLIFVALCISQSDIGLAENPVTDYFRLHCHERVEKLRRISGEHGDQPALVEAFRNKRLKRADLFLEPSHAILRRAD